MVSFNNVGILHFRADSIICISACIALTARADKKAPVSQIYRQLKFLAPVTFIVVSFSGDTPLPAAG